VTPVAALIAVAPRGWAYHVFAYFPCNASGVRVAVKRSRAAAQKFADTFAKRNRVETALSFKAHAHRTMRVGKAL
jgi:hypothetical protein